MNCTQTISSLNVFRGREDFPKPFQHQILEICRCHYNGDFTSQQELGVADHTDLQDLKILKGAAGLITAATRGAGDWLCNQQILDVSQAHFLAYGHKSLVVQLGVEDAVYNVQCTHALLSLVLICSQGIHHCL